MKAAHPSRRALLGVAALAGAAALTGCSARGSDASDGRTAARPGPSPTATAGGHGGLGTGPPADPAASARSKADAWRYTHLADTWNGSYQALAASSRDDVWAFGAMGGLKDGKPPTSVFLDHWDGSRWLAHPLPDGLDPKIQSWALAASGPGDLWLAGRPIDGSVPSAYHWDGRTWQTLPAPPVSKGPPIWTGGVDGPWMAAAGPRHLWICLRGRTLYWDGSGWHLPELPFGATAITASPQAADGAAAAWVVGARGTVGGGCGSDTCYPQPASARWKGSGWQRMDTPAYRFPDPVPPEADAHLDTVVYDPVRKSLWAFGRNDFAQGETDDEPEVQTIVLTGDGSGWAKRGLPSMDRALATATTVPDGAGSLLLDSQTRITRDGKVVRLGNPANVPDPPERPAPSASSPASPAPESASPSKQKGDGQTMQCVVTCLVPGTRTVLAAGAVRAFLPGTSEQPVRPMLARYDAGTDGWTGAS